MSDTTFSRRILVDADYREQEKWEDHLFGDWMTQEEEEDGREYAKLRIPPRKLGWARGNVVSFSVVGTKVHMVGMLILAVNV